MDLARFMMETGLQSVNTCVSNGKTQWNLVFCDGSAYEFDVVGYATSWVNKVIEEHIQRPLNTTQQLIRKEMKKGKVRGHFV